LKSRGIVTALDCVFHLPFRYEDWRSLCEPRALEPGMTATLAGTLRRSSEGMMPRVGYGRRMVTGRLLVGNEAVRLVWFNLPTYLARLIPFGRTAIVHGKVSAAPDEELQIVNPAFHVADSSPAPALRPVYGLPSAVGQRLFSELVRKLLRDLDPKAVEAIPRALRRAAGLFETIEALRYLHCPPASADLSELCEARSEAHHLLALEELFAFELAMQLDRRRAQAKPGFAFSPSSSLSSALLASLPFSLTGAQQRVIREIDADVTVGRPMNRLLVGDVGSGKTVVALWAAMRAVESGRQAAVMAPTELLAEQHHRAFQKYGAGLGVPCALLTSGVGAAARAQCLRDLARGRISLVFGTHALIQRSVAIANLGLAVIDEQHRFGVFDRARLKALGPNAHMLLMTATPIPRSLALVLFANLDVSFLDEMPPARWHVATRMVAESDFETVERLARDKVRDGGRAYFVLPAIGEDEETADERAGMPTVAAMARRLARGALGDLKIGVLHGRMAGAQRQAMMRNFREGKLDVLVATTMVEVGIDVPEASAMVIIDAHRYGLAQLHQLRGRVGRSDLKAECVLVVPEDLDPKARARLAVLLDCSDGAEVARADLELRGPGDLLGSRQSGALPLRFARFVGSVELIAKARAMAEQLLASPSGIRGPEASGARQALKRMLRHGFGLADVG
jgi:ATP-dependent DNA helicase RecG